MSWWSRLFSVSPELPASAAPISFTNTLSGKKDLFTPLKQGFVSLYSCGPTVYSRAHIGNLRAYVFADTIARVLTGAGYHVRRVINITDVGHLVGDGDHGEDKIEREAREKQESPEQIATRYTDLFLEDLDALNIDTENIFFPRATAYIKEQIAMIRALEARGVAYQAGDGIYFDTSKFPQYGKLGGVNEAKLLPGARVEKIAGKKNASDFVLWRNAKPHDLQKWDSPWGPGNPGWHIECSAMIKSLLGIEIDIHTGGMDHIPTHHNNEIAQSEVANGRPLARYWMHEAFLTIGADKISKSLKNDVYLPDIIERDYSPLALRYFFLQAHYRTPLSFTWEALAAANAAHTRLARHAAEIRIVVKGMMDNSRERELFITYMRDDLATPAALSVLWDAIKDEELSPEEKWGLFATADAYLGLALTEPSPPDAGARAELPEAIQALVYERDLARGAKDYAKADQIRYQLEERGYLVEDSPSGTLVSPRRG